MTKRRNNPPIQLGEVILSKARHKRLESNGLKCSASAGEPGADFKRGDGA